MRDVCEKLDLAYSSPILTAIDSPADLKAYLAGNDVLTREMWQNSHDPMDQVKEMFETRRKGIPSNVEFVPQHFRKEHETDRLKRIL